ncbi:MAG TPA: flavin reductase family protein [Candidatus Binatia bacterium]|nr:flavin reductase family protein [Candidatus Binatia bacterium]
MPSFNPAEFRRALGSFATGVTIITTRAPDGAPLGLTVNSFNSVSLSPPLVLWSLANNALSLPVFKGAAHWAVHVLAADQDELSQRFARRGENKFGGLALEQGAGGVPLLTGCTARFQCRNAFQYDGGDHVIFVGEVLAFDGSDAPPLVFHGGRYAHATRREPQEARRAYMAGSFSEDFLGYLLGRAHFSFFGQLRPYLAKERLGDAAFYVLSTLTLKPLTPAAELDRALYGILGTRSTEVMSALIGRGLAAEAPVVMEAEGPEYRVTGLGRETALRLIAAAKALESELIARLGAADAQVLKALLNRLLTATDPASPFAGRGDPDKVKTTGTGWSE